MKLWPWKRGGADLETRATQFDLVPGYMTAKRSNVRLAGTAALSATVAACGGAWSRAFAMLRAEPDADLLPAPILASVGLDLLLKGESCWHIRSAQGEIELVPVAAWDELGGGHFSLHISHPNTTETVAALEAEVVRLIINPDPLQLWRGRSPLHFAGLSPVLMAEIEAALSGALPYAGKGLLPMPATLSGEQSGKVLSGLQSGSLAVITSKADMAVHSGGDRNEIKRVELSPDMRGLELTESASGLHNRLLTACGVPPALLSDTGNAGASREAYRLFVLQTISPLARILLPELKRKLGIDRLSLADMMAADVAGRARAVSSLVQAGVPVQVAMGLVGWEGQDLAGLSKVKTDSGDD
ncbi:phage portal protein [Cypionkella sp.]|uniref:phage portal protein n=1 Tax=Cypionkella sp. TaxID=2811411 RepID=UPI002613CF01|nr:phage portal protein [Cypionkella sp.]MDB5663552.1 phage portal protein [Cypionkella sp.]